MIKNIAVIGGGPAGCTTAILLRRKGFNVGVFYLEKRPEIIVGESLVPAIIPYLRELGIEDEIREFSTYKPGASVWPSINDEASSPFSMAQGSLPDYAYNVPRKEFDEVLFKRARKEGVTFFNTAARLEVKGDEVFLTQDTLAQTNNFFGGQPDLILDCSGRSRYISRLLKIPSKSGKRKDVALFAHLTGVMEVTPYNIHLHRLSKGWAWRIPLKDRMSIGVVIDPSHLQDLGKTKEEQYDAFLQKEEVLKKFTQGGTRVTGVQQYDNYQLISERYHGKNWALVGDAGGFLDPIFSSGLFLSVKGGFDIAAVIGSGEQFPNLRQYEKDRHWELEAWQELVDIWYDGRLFTFMMVGRQHENTFMGRLLAPWIRKHMTRVFSGEAVYVNYSRKFLHFVTGPMIRLMKAGRLHDRVTKDLAVK